MPGYKNRFSFCPGAGSRTAVARKGLDIKRSELDSLFIQQPQNAAARRIGSSWL
jgi:hypothetical protein